MTIYEFVHTTYDWHDNDYFVNETMLFTSYEDAITYFNCKVEQVTDIYLDETNLDTVEEFENEDFCSYTLYDNTEIEPDSDAGCYWPRFHIAIDEYGRDEMRLYKKQVMSFE